MQVELVAQFEKGTRKCRGINSVQHFTHFTQFRPPCDRVRERAIAPYRARTRLLSLAYAHRRISPTRKRNESARIERRKKGSQESHLLVEHLVLLVDVGDIPFHLVLADSRSLGSFVQTEFTESVLSQWEKEQSERTPS